MYKNTKTHLIDGNVSITQIAMLSDNYSYIIYDDKDNTAVIVDPSSSDYIIGLIRHYNMNPAHIICTHHHYDHTGGIKDIKKEFPDIKVIASKQAKAQIPLADTMVSDKQSLALSKHIKLSAIHTPGHTKGSMCFYFSHQKHPFVLTGDTLFSFGCGKVFEGTYKQMYESINKLKQLPDNTLVFCGHEYSLQNLLFAQSIYPDDVEISKAINQAIAKTDNDQFIVPTTIKQERLLNPFMRAESLQEFTKIRKAKDSFVT